MWQEFHNINDLLVRVTTDKEVAGDDGFVANRYPIRFVLFDNFKDSFDFIHHLSCNVKSVEKWMDGDYPDRIITHTELVDKFVAFFRKNEDNDFVIAPFSELARFYDNEKTLQFEALIRTIKSLESTQNGFNKKQRIYIPLVGLEGKMSKFANETQIKIWYFKNIDSRLNYRLILTKSTYGVKRLEVNHTIINSIKEWLNIWQQEDAKKRIISLSPSLFANAEYAQPDNAFDFCTCNNVFDFLVNGLNLNFGEITYREQDEKYWLRLAKEIDINHFSLDSFFNEYFHIDQLADYNVFLKTWFGCNDDFEKWLLCTYYLEKFCNQNSYICQCIKNSHSYNTTDFFASVVLSVFDCEEAELYMEERKVCMDFASKNGVIVNVDVEERMQNELVKIAEQQGYTIAVKYLTHLTLTEKRLVINWLGQKKINIGDVKDVYPDLYYYLSGTLDSILPWIPDYFEAYRKCKIANAISDDIAQIINVQNKNHVSFNFWYNSFKTTKTILNNREDVEVIYWIDGLGMEWIPYISWLLSLKEGVYLNETHIARASYPTTTAINKISLEELSHNNLKKIGDLDNHAHQNTNKYPEYLIEEFKIVNEAILKIISEYAGKKIAIVSDHGITAMSQYCNGLNLVGYKSDHGGRLAVKESGKPNIDDNYVICEDGKTVCALKHNSLCGKIPTGQSAHGGCTPEEVLVPIFIISSQKETSKYSTKLLTTEITVNNPVIEFEIKGDNVANPYIMYGNTRYNLTKSGNNYRTETLALVAATTMITLHIGSDYKQTFSLKINVGAKEDDLFDF